MKCVLLGYITLITYCQASLLFSSPVSVEKLNNKYIEQATTTSVNDVKEVREAIFTQWVDHTNRGATFDQYTFINDAYYQPGGPILILVSATTDTYMYWMQNSHMVNIASELGGVIYALEPRYFGRSYPTSDLTLENLEKYLHLNQTMADYADFITYLRSEFINYDSDKFVLVGHGRGGTLANWIHHRYPGLADGVWAAGSPPISTTDWAGYYDGINITIKQEFPISCQQTINEAFLELDYLVNHGDIDTIRNIFIFDSDLDLSNQHDVALFYMKLFELLFSPIEYGTPLTLSIMCSAFDPLEGYSSLQILGNYYGTALNNQVFKYDTLVSILKEETLEAEAVVSNQRQELYIRCAGWSMFKTSSLMDYPLNRFPITLFGDVCNDVFGISFDTVIKNNVRTENENLFNVNIQNMFFTNGEFDPHHLIGIHGDMSSTLVASLIPRLGKLFDFHRYVYFDAASYALYEARDRAIELITLWTARNV